MLRVAISGEFLRPGQEGNIAWFYTVLKNYLPFPFLVQGRPLSFEEWIFARLDDKELYRDAFRDYDLVIGFEMHEAARDAAKKWVNIKRHPYRWSMPLWSLQASFPVDVLYVIPPNPGLVPKRGPEESCFMTQVSSDATLLKDYGIVYPDALLPEIILKTKDYETLWIVPHPMEQTGIWVSGLLVALPNARVWRGTAYEAMADLRTMYTASSSTGWEAPFFGCNPHLFLKSGPFSRPCDISNPALWQIVLRAASGSEN
jgi:hypothetical protein